MIERCEQTLITRISGLIKTPHTGCATTVYAAVNPELIGISRGYYKHSRAAPSWPSKAGRWGITLPISKISNLPLNDIFERKKCIQKAMQDSNRVFCWRVFFFWSLKRYPINLLHLIIYFYRKKDFKMHVLCLHLRTYIILISILFISGTPNTKTFSGTVHENF